MFYKEGSNYNLNSRRFKCNEFININILHVKKDISIFSTFTDYNKWYEPLQIMINGMEDKWLYFEAL